ncbi:Leucine-rich repeat protein 1 [Linum perenne]
MEATAVLICRTIGLFVLAVTLLKVEGQGSSTSDEQALTSLRSSLSDPDNVLNSWDPTYADPCTWFHVTCDNDNRVTRLSLEDNMLNGSIPAELGNLKNLIVLDLFNNSLSGSIPSSLGSNLESLKFLRLQDNQLTGEIPKSLADIPNLILL